MRSTQGFEVIITCMETSNSVKFFFKWWDSDITILHATCYPTH